MRVRVNITGLRELQANLKVARDTVASIGTSGAALVVAEAVAESTLRNVSAQGSLNADGPMDGGRYPWGSHSRTYVGKLGQLKTEGATYQLVDSGDMVTSIAVPWSRYFQLGQSPTSIALTSLVIYAVHAQARWGAWLVPGSDMQRRVEASLQTWMQANLPGDWRVS